MGALVLLICWFLGALILAVPGAVPGNRWTIDTLLGDSISLSLLLYDSPPKFTRLPDNRDKC